MAWIVRALLRLRLRLRSSGAGGRRAGRETAGVITTTMNQKMKRQQINGPISGQAQTQKQEQQRGAAQPQAEAPAQARLAGASTAASGGHGPAQASECPAPAAGSRPAAGALQRFVPAKQAQVLRVLWRDRGEALWRSARAADQLNRVLLRFGHGLEEDAQAPGGLGEGSRSGPLLVPEQPGVRTVQGVPLEGLPDAVRLVITGLEADKKSARKDVTAATAAVVHYVESREWPTGRGEVPGTELLPVLQTTPGVGPITALTWLVGVIDPRRFEHARQVRAFCRCDPASGRFGRRWSRGRPSGNLELRWALMHAAASLVRRATEELGQWGRNLAGRHERGGYWKAVEAVARRMASALWQVHLRCEPFRYQGYRLKLRAVERQDQPGVKLVVERSKDEGEEGTLNLEA